MAGHRASPCAGPSLSPPSRHIPTDSTSPTAAALRHRPPSRSTRRTGHPARAVLAFGCGPPWPDRQRPPHTSRTDRPGAPGTRLGQSSPSAAGRPGLIDGHAPQASRDRSTEAPGTRLGQSSPSAAGRPGLIGGPPRGQTPKARKRAWEIALYGPWRSGCALITTAGERIRRSASGLSGGPQADRNGKRGSPFPLCSRGPSPRLRLRAAPPP